MTDHPPPNPAQARKSAMSVGVVLALIAAWNLWKDRPTAVMIFAGLAAALLLTALAWPSGARLFHSSWMRLAAVLGYVNSRILLSVMFYGVFTPYGMVMRLFGRDVLNRRGPAKDSYWIPRAKTRQSHEQYERLF